MVLQSISAKPDLAMKPNKFLSKLCSQSIRRLVMLRGIVDSLPQGYSRQSDRYVSYAAIRTLSVWSEFSRSYYLSYTLSPITRDGVNITTNNTSVTKFEDAIWEITKRLKRTGKKKRQIKRREEPSWHNPSCIIKGCQILEASNSNDVYAALSTQSKALEHLPVFRNFYSHRSDDTAIKALRLAHKHYSIPRLQHPTMVLLERPSGRPQSLLAEWIDDIKIIILALT